MSFLLNPHLNLTTVRIETKRYVLVPFSLDGRVDIHELTEEFCKVNKDFFVSPFLPNYEQEIKFLQKVMQDIEEKKVLELFILEKNTNRFIGCVGLNRMEEHRMNIWLWIRTDEHGKWYATEVYVALINWAQENIRYRFLRHALDPRNEASRKLALKFGGILQDETDEKEVRFTIFYCRTKNNPPKIERIICYFSMRFMSSGSLSVVPLIVSAPVFPVTLYPSFSIEGLIFPNPPLPVVVIVPFTFPLLELNE